jgi:transcriptional regulator with XRE-family HTH domain
MSDALQVNGSILRQSRDALGWSQGELASRACLSVKQVKQLEEGGSSSFYSEGVKLTAARKVAQMLGVSEDELWGREPQPQAEMVNDSEDTVLPDQSHAHQTTAQHTQDTHDQIAAEPLLPSGESHVNDAAIRSPILVPGVQSVHMRSEVLHILAQPPEESELELDSHDADSDHLSDEEPSTSLLAAQPSQSVAHEQESLQETHSLNSSQTEQSSSTPEEKSSSVVSNLIKFVLLFAVALAVAAYFAQKNKPEQKEVAPPLQAVPEGSPSNGTSAPESSGKADDASAAPQAAQTDKTQTSEPGASGSSASSAPAPSIPGSAQPLKSNTNTGAPKLSAPAQEPKSSSSASVPASPKSPSASPASVSPSMNVAPPTTAPGNGG